MARQVQGPWYRASKGTWYATVGGKHVSLGVRGQESEPAARVAWHRLMAGMGTDAPTAGEPDSNTPAPTVKALVDAFLADVADRAKPATVEIYTRLLRSFVGPFAHRRADGITPHDAESFARKPSWSASTRNAFLRVLVTAYRWAVRSGLTNANPLTGVRKPPGKSRGAEAVLTADQFQRLYAAAPASLKPFLRGLWLTGCRPGELAALTAADVDFVNGVAVLNDHKTAGKTGKPRLIFLCADALSLFREQAAAHPTGPLFHNSVGGAWSDNTLSVAVRRVRKRAGLPHAIAYGFRHTYATQALANGIPDATVAALLGHTGTAMLHRHYSHLTSRTDVLRQAAALVHKPGKRKPRA